MASTKHFINVLGMLTITVLVGEGEAQASFIVLKELICTRSEFFRVSMKEVWKEGKEGIISLPKDDPQIFALYVQSLFAGHVFQGEEAEAKPEYYVLLGNTFKLAQKLLDVQARNMIVQAIFDKVRNSVQPSGCEPSSGIATMIKTIWDVTISSSPIRRLLVDIFVFFQLPICALDEFQCTVSLLGCLKRLPSEYLSELSVALLRNHCLVLFKDRAFEVEQYIEKVPDNEKWKWG